MALNHFLRSRFSDATWISIAVVLNPRIGLHQDILNIIGKSNHAIDLGSLPLPSLVFIVCDFAVSDKCPVLSEYEALGVVLM